MRNRQKYLGLIVGVNLLLFTMLFSNSTADEIKFSHKLHMENEVECATCHQSTENSETGKDNLLPSMEVCSDCHDIEDDNECKTCHTVIDEPGIAPRVTSYSVLFSHKQHMKSDIDCFTCHSGISDKVKVGSFHLPVMSACMDCHQQKAVKNECSNCHTDDEELRPKSHKGDFQHIHGQMAKSGGIDASANMECAVCHQDNYCQNCHEGENLDKSIHPLNFEFTHSFKARGKEQECMTCHTERLFCVECHNQNLIMPHNHGVGWLNSVPGDGGFHRQEASADLESCMVCHEKNATSICQPCHGE